MATAFLAVFLLAMLGGFLGIACVDRHALPQVLTAAAVLVIAGGFVAALFSL